MTDKTSTPKAPLTLGQLITWLCLIGFAFLVLLALSNWQHVHLRLFMLTFTVPIGLMIIISLIVGSFAGIADYLSLPRRGKQGEIKQQWQVQDAKLAANIGSDREKQLEAKIATLETALDKALKKQS